LTQEKENQRLRDDLALRKQVEVAMSSNLLKHEDQTMNMSQKLILMKNQVMEYDRHIGMDRKFGAVRITTLKNYPVTVSDSIS